MMRDGSYMAREVAEIPEAARRFLALSAEATARAAVAMRAADPALVVTVARGSSDHAATYLKYAVELSAGIPVASVGPSIASIYRRPLRLGRAACIGISQSGQSPDIVEMMQAAAAGGALTVAVTNHADSPVLAGLALLAEWQEDAALRKAVAGLPEAFAQALTLDWSALSDRLSRAQSLYVLGRGPAFAIASEAALKFKETCGLHAEAFSAAEVLHGPSAIVQAQFPVLALGVSDAALPRLTETAARLAAQGADVFLTGADVAGVTRLPSVPDLHPLCAPLVLAVGFYAFVEALARRRGFDPDVPPHLRKVTRTV
jgi:glutamine---fructose-6-phosphate transaminase (isomerizing)